MKTILLGIAIILFGISLMLCSPGDAVALALGISFIGLMVSVFGFIMDKGSKY